MQQSEAFERQLRETYAAIVVETFARAHRCLTYARIARLEGDHAQVRKLLGCVRVLRMAAAEWRTRAQSVATVLVCLLWLVGCVTTPDCRVTESVSLPYALVTDACEEGYGPNAIMTLDHAEVVFYDDAPWGLDCDVYDFGIADHRRTLVNFHQQSTAVDRIRGYLKTNGVPVPVRVL